MCQSKILDLLKQFPEKEFEALEFKTELGCSLEAVNQSLKGVRKFRLAHFRSISAGRKIKWVYKYSGG